MNWAKVLIAGVVGGIALFLADGVMHGAIMGNTYTKYPDVFSQEQASLLWFLVISICIAFFAAVLFAKTRDCWGDGYKGGATYGFFLGLVFFFHPFYSVLVIDGFPYYLAWCHGGIALIGAVILGAVIALVYKRG